MTKRSDQRKNSPPTSPKRGGPTAADIKANTRPAEPDEEQTYDPAGMAGKKAGKVVEIEDQVREEGSANKGPGSE